MKTGGKRFSRIVVLVFILLLLLITAKQQRSLERLRATNNGLPMGNEIAGMELLPAGSSGLSPRTPGEEGFAFLFVFEEPCVPCNNNIPYWNRIQRMVKERAQCLGIIKNSLPEDLRSLRRRVDFDLFMPVDPRAFDTALKSDNTQAAITLFLKDGRVTVLHRGNFRGGNFARFVNTCKKKLLKGESQ